MGTELHQTDATAWRTFTSDLRLAFSALRKAPSLVTASAVINVVPLVAIGTGNSPDSMWWPMIMLATVVLSIWLVGWPGAERIWYLRLFRGSRMSLREALAISRDFLRPFIGLGLHVTVRVAVPYIAVAAWYANSDGRWGPLALTAAISFVVDIWLTFVTQALAFTTTDASEALQIGRAFLKEHWRRARWFALVPPLAALVALRTASPNLDFPVVVSLSVLGIMLNLLFKGATAAYYLRYNDVPNNGSLESN